MISEHAYSVASVRSIEAYAFTHTVSAKTLMERAGQAAFDVLKHYYPNPVSVKVLCGSGNNGGDGYVLARLAHAQGYPTEIIRIDEPTTDCAKEMCTQCLELGITITAYQEQELIFQTSDVVVDALLGIGLERDVTGLMASVISRINTFEGFVLALDVPSGLCADRGVPLGCAIIADATVTLIAYKVGLLMGPARDYVGALHGDDLGVEELPQNIMPTCYTLPGRDYDELFIPRLHNSHKGHFGHVLVVGGDLGMPGAALLAAQAALRVGAGQVTILTHAINQAGILSACPEAMCAPLERLADMMASADVVVVGPGMSHSDWSKQMWQEVNECSLPMVVDAGALYFLAQNPSQSSGRILTPHPGEASLLLECTSEAVQNNRLQKAHELQHRYGGSVVLKGCGTLIQGLERTSVCSLGNPGMSSAGTGDVLSGVMGGLLAQGFPINDAAEWGVYLHALAGDRAAHAGGERGLMASDVIAELRALVNHDFNERA